MNKNDELKAVSLIDKILSLSSSGQIETIMQHLNHLKQKYSHTINYALNGPACWIEVGSIYRDKSQVVIGINLANQAVTVVTKPDQLVMLQYNIANGYMSLFDIFRRDKKKLYIEDYDLVRKAKQHYWTALSLNTRQSIELAKILTNYGNCLDSLGRSLESFENYYEALKVWPKFAMAKANYGKALCYFANIAGTYRIAQLVEGYQHIAHAIETEEEIIEIGGIAALTSFRNKLKEIENYFQDKTLLKVPIPHPPLRFNSMSLFEKFYTKFSYENHLFLNFHIHGNLCKSGIGDPIFITLFESIKEKSRFKDLAKHVNQLKEDYITSRYLLCLAQYKRPETNRISKITIFADTLDYTQFNLYTGFLKVSFCIAFNILDKISVFLNKYLELGVKKKIYFDTIWDKKDEEGNHVPNSIINQIGILPLYGLYDINADFKNGILSELKRIRNAATHERLIIVEDFASTQNDAADAITLGFDEMVDRTIWLLRVVRSAIVNLINTVNIIEMSKVRKSEGIVVPMFFHTDQFL